MLPNEVFALECIARYAREGLVRDSTWQFAHCPYPRPKGQKNRLPGDKGYWLTFEDHQKQGLLQSVDVGRKCYFTPYAKRYLDTYPPNYFELYDIYNQFNSGENHSQFGVPNSEAQKKANSERMSGEKNPCHSKTGALHPASKAIIAIQPDGTKLYFVSITEAAKVLDSKGSNLWKYLKRGKVIKKGPLKGYQFFYEVKE
jgi:hypothetical protein